MTRDATNSTSDASGGESPAREETVLSAVVGGNLAAAAAFGMDRAALLRAANVDEADLVDPDGRVPFERHVALWEAICARPEAMSFALWLGQTLNIEALGVVGYVMQHAGDVRAALRCFE
ncbi:MAG: AraC family transcriptional regulator ligand-binding domain-containing protein, partial [Polyangiaceae bacterium]